MIETETFIYEEAFERNRGWLTDKEQDCLQKSCVAIAGLGGAGGFQVEALARLGVGSFKIADPDTFELSNMNRQRGASRETLGRYKVDVTQEMILSINPEARVEIFQEPITETNVNDFIEGADIIIDGIDFFEQEAKEILFRKSRERGITALTSCPLGFGTSIIVFSPKGMRYEDYFDIREGMSTEEKRFRTTFGLSPSPLCLKYMNGRALDFKGKKASSVAPGLMLVGALTSSEVVKILTGKDKVHYCPYVYQIDLLTYHVRHKYYRWGMQSLWLRFKRWLVMRIFTR